MKVTKVMDDTVSIKSIDSKSKSKSDTPIDEALKNNSEYEAAIDNQSFLDRHNSIWFMLRSTVMILSIVITTNKFIAFALIA